MTVTKVERTGDDVKIVSEKVVDISVLEKQRDAIVGQIYKLQEALKSVEGILAKVSNPGLYEEIKEK